MKSLLTAVIAVAALALMPPPDANGSTLRLTPDAVVGMWTNINEALVVASRATVRDPAVRGRIATMTPVAVEGKVPADVLHQVELFTESLNRVRERSHLHAVHAEVEGEGGAVDPTVVFESSVAAIEGLLDWLARSTGPEQTLSGFFDFPEFDGQTPNDAFALVELATRRMQLISNNS